MQILDNFFTDVESQENRSGSKPLFSSRGKMMIASFAVVMCMFAFMTGPSANHSHNYQVMSLHQDDGRRCNEYASILGASWGTTDVTKLVADKYNKGMRNFAAKDEEFGKILADGSENLTIVSRRCGNVAVKAVKKGDSINLP